MCEKAWRFLETLLTHFNLTSVLRCRLNPDLLGWMLDEKRLLEPAETFGRRRAAGSRASCAAKQTFVPWDTAQLQKWCGALFRRPATGAQSLLDTLVVVLRALGVFADQFKEPAILDVVFKFCPTYRMPSFELALDEDNMTLVENWLTLAEYSATLGQVVCRRMGRDCDKFEAFLEESMRHSLSHARKMASVSSILEEIVPSRPNSSSLGTVVTGLKQTSVR